MTAMPEEGDAAEPSIDLDIPNAADPKRLARQKNRASREEEESRTFWRAVFASQSGRREMWRILGMGHAFEERFSADGSSEKTWIMAGEQRLAFRLYRMWQALDFDGAALMQRENDPAIQR